jgi:hypothetical protein
MLRERERERGRERERANRIILRHCLRWIGVDEEGAGPE